MRSERMTCQMRHTLRVSRLWKILLKTLFAVPLSARFFILPSVLLFGSVEAMQAQTEHLLYSFAGNPDGAVPYASLVRHNGIFYGTTVSGGTFGDGTVFKVTITGKETVLHSFSGGADGSFPYGSLVFDKLGNLYGTTSGGGTFNSGTVFEITSSGTEAVLYAFTGGADGSTPYAGLVFDKLGNLYGTTFVGGTFNSGTVFKLSPSRVETVLYSFTGGADGNGPIAGLVLDPSGNLYGTTPAGGMSCLGGSGSGCGVVFEVTSGSEKVLHSFTGDVVDGLLPSYGSLARAGARLYGTTWQGGQNDRGTVYEVNTSGGETVLFSFLVGVTGYTPNGTLIFDKYGNLYGTTVNSGTPGGCGAIFEISPSAGFLILYDFTINRPDGCNPYGGLVRDTKGNLYGTTANGGTFGKGTLFELTP
jgi:uncharacterized repeat protein (TIGR03803 family)